MAKNKKGLQYYFNRVEKAQSEFEKDITSGGQYIFVGVQRGQKVYIEKSTGHIMRLLWLPPLSKII